MSERSPIRTTPCQCADSGWCARHQLWKTPQLHALCGRSHSLFALWESGVGPGQAPSQSAPEEGVSAARRAVRFAAAAIRHVVDGCRTVDDATFNSRLAACRACDACDIATMVCRDSRCGCRLLIKARWRSQSCPRSAWPVLPDSTHEMNETPSSS